MCCEHSSTEVLIIENENALLWIALYEAVTVPRLWSLAGPHHHCLSQHWADHLTERNDECLLVGKEHALLLKGGSHEAFMKEIFP